MLKIKFSIVSFVLLFILSSVIAFSQPLFEKYFENKTLRIDYVHAGDKENDYYFLDELIEEPYWGGSQKHLLTPFNYGKYRIEVKDIASGELIYSYNFSTLFSEWQTIEEAKTVARSFNESVVIPFPKNKVEVDFFTRQKDDSFLKKYSLQIDPKNYFIKKDRRHVFPVKEILKNGDSQNKVDIVMIPEGYTIDELEKFESDCKKFTGYLFNASPFKENESKFNVTAVMAPSKESGTDIPGKSVYKETILDSKFYTFDVERYLMVSDYKKVRDVAANASYDHIYVIVNSPKYGGGAIFNHYAVCVNTNQHEEYVFVHEFGHSFASLADEYYESETAYQDFYPQDREPIDPNLTSLKDFGSKWKHLVDESTPIPTPNESEYHGKVGAFEGGGYVAKGIYRPQHDCTMKSISVDNFCIVCKNAIQSMIDFYAE
ncbi:MAG: M64 family metallopeptidase [Ignavibacteria bacterium]|nr:M64 family metallopeptidase [Ignavibacteria bacterium]